MSILRSCLPLGLVFFLACQADVPTPDAAAPLSRAEQAKAQQKLILDAQNYSNIAGMELVRRDTARSTDPVTGKPNTEITALFRNPQTGEERFITQRIGGQALPDPADQIFNKVDVMPFFPTPSCAAADLSCNQRALLTEVQRRVKYPEAAKQADVHGTLLLTFVVEPDGSRTGIRVLDGLHPALNAEAIRVVSDMQAWTPGTRDGKPVRTQFALPVRF